MNKRNIFLISTIIIISLVLVNSASADLLYGCPKHELIMRKPKRTDCPIGGSPLSKVKEGYIGGGRKGMLDTLSQAEKKRLGIQGTRKFIVVIYKSPYTGKASFLPGEDRFGNELEKAFVQMKYDCKRILSSSMINDYCKPLGYSPEEVERQMQKNIRTIIPKIKASMEKTINESRPIYYRQQKDFGYSDEQINRLWENYKKRIYEEYDYDPESGQFKSLKVPEAGMEYYRDPKTGKFKPKKIY